MARKAQSATYALGAVVRLTGVSDHTLRAWERRYGVVKPQRTPGGTRRYSESDIARLRLLRRGVDAGHPISELAKLSDREIERRLGALVDEPSPRMDVFVRVLERLDERELERLLGARLAALGAREFGRTVAAPLLREIGELWRAQKLSVAAEHAATVALRGLLGSALRFGPESPSGVTILFSTPPGERHELGTLIAAVCAQQLGARALYLGPDLPLDEIVEAALEADVDAVAVGVVKRARKTLQADLRELRGGLPLEVGVWVGGAAVQGLQPPSGVLAIESLEQLEEQVELLLARA
jgi:DNA-binding transcriptional MerR regulator